MATVYDPVDPRWSTNPWPGYAELRENAPIHHNDQGFWVLTRHADCLHVLRDKRASADAANINPEKAPAGVPGDRRSSSKLSSSELRELMAAEQDNRPFLFRDPPDHTRLRGLVAKAFTPRMVDGLRARTQAIVDELVDVALQKSETEEVDLLADFAYPLPVRIICDMLGVPEEDQHLFPAWSATLARSLDPDFLLTEDIIKERMDAILAFAAYFFPLLADRREHPGDDLLSALAVAEDGGDTLSEGEMLSTSILLLVAGHETTVNLLAGGLLALAQHPDQLVRLRDDPAIERTAVEELLRFVSPVQLTGRSMTEDLPLDDVVLPKGELALLLIGSANRDPLAFENPEQLDVGREPNRHLGFGFGIHHCLGAPLARLEAQVALPTLLRRARTIEVDLPNIRYRPNVVLRGLEALPTRLVAN